MKRFAQSTCLSCSHGAIRIHEKEKNLYSEEIYFGPDFVTSYPGNYIFFLFVCFHYRIEGKKVRTLSHVQLFVTPWTVACHPSMSVFMLNQAFKSPACDCAEQINIRVVMWFLR